MTSNASSESSATEQTDSEPMSAEQEQQAREMAKGLAETRQQLLEANVSDVVANHAFGIYELAAIHLTAEQPDMVASRVAIDALGALVEGLSGRLGEAEKTLTEALQQIRMMFVQRTTQLKKAAESTSESSDDAPSTLDADPVSDKS